MELFFAPAGEREEPRIRREALGARGLHDLPGAAAVPRPRSLAGRARVLGGENDDDRRVARRTPPPHRLLSLTYPAKVALPGPFARKLSTPVRASLVLNTSTNSSCSRDKPSAQRPVEPTIDGLLWPAPDRPALPGPTPRPTLAPRRTRSAAGTTRSARPIRQGLVGRHLATASGSCPWPARPHRAERGVACRHRRG